jgi:threonine synthase
MMTSALEQGLMSDDERAVLFNCGNGLNHPIPTADNALDRTSPIDWDALAAG